jgi:hypothetical protein
MSSVISIAIRKGGVGKSTTAVNVATALHLKGFKTLLVDLEHTANATISVGINPYILKTSITDLFSRYEVGSRRIASANRLGKVFPGRSLLLSDGPTRPTSARFQLPLPEPCGLLSQHTALQGCDSTCIGLLRHPPHPLGFVHPPLRPFTLS